MKPSSREFLQLYCKIHRWKNDGGCAFYHNTLRIPNTALRKPNWYSTQVGTYEADIGSFLCWQRKRTRGDIENWGHFLLASWPTTLSQHVAGNNFVPATYRMFVKKRACRTRKTAVAVRSRFFYPRHVPAVMKFIIILCCFTFVWWIYIFFFQNKVLSPDESAEKLIKILKENTFTSGSHVDYFDWEKDDIRWLRL